MKCKKAPVIIGVIMCFILLAPWAMAEEEALYEKSGAQDMYNSLGEETRELLSLAGVEEANVGGDFSWEGLGRAFSNMLRDKITAPIRAVAALLAVVILCKAADCFERREISSVCTLVGTAACAAVAAIPMVSLMESAAMVVDSASVFLISAVPVYTGLMMAAGSAAAGASYGLLTLTVGNAIPLLAAGVIFPLLHVFMALSVASSISSVKLDKLAGSLYGFGKWLLILLVTIFSGILSVQTVVNNQVDAATNKAAKLLASSTIPIVGSAFGDAIAAIQSSVGIVKSGVSAFGILAALCIFVPIGVEALLWVGVCTAGQIAADLFDLPKISGFLGGCASVARMVFAVLVSICAVSVVSAAVVLFVKGGI